MEEMRRKGAHGLLPITTCVRDRHACELDDSVPNVGSILCAGRQPPAHSLNDCLRTRLSMESPDSMATATYHHVVNKSVNSICFYCRLSEDNLSVYFDVLLRSKMLAGALAERRTVYLESRWDGLPISIWRSKRSDKCPDLLKSKVEMEELGSWSKLFKGQEAGWGKAKFSDPHEELCVAGNARCHVVSGDNMIELSHGFNSVVM